MGDIHWLPLGPHRKGLAGSFVDLPNTQTGFLPDSARLGPPTEGRLATLRTDRAAQHGKGPRLRELPDPASGPPRLLRHGPGALERLATLWPDAKIQIDSPAIIPLANLTGRAHPVRQAFPDDLEEEVAALTSPTHPLPGWGAMHIEPTRALTAIDLDWTGDASDRRRGMRLFTEAALPEIARQIILRNLAGILLLDATFLPARDRPATATTLARLAAADPAGCRFTGFTPLGLAELVRTRLHPPLAELLAGPHAAAIAAARAAITAATPAATSHLRLAPTVAAAFNQDAFLRTGLEQALPHGLVLRADPALAPCGWKLEAP